MGIVDKAEDKQFRIPVALKSLSRDALGDEEAQNRLIREAGTAAALGHPNIFRVYAVHQEVDQTFVAMAFLDGPSLDQKIKERRLPLETAFDIAIQGAKVCRKPTGAKGLPGSTVYRSAVQPRP